MAKILRITEDKMKELMGMVYPSNRMYYDIIHFGGDPNHPELKCVGFTNAFFRADGEYTVEINIVDDEDVYIDVYADEESLKGMGNKIDDVISEIEDTINQWMPYRKINVEKTPHLYIHFGV